MVVVPLRKSNQLPKDKIPDDFFKEVRRRRETTKRDIDEPYIAAKFSPSELPKRFNVGDKNFKNLYGYYNKELSKGSYYTMFTRAYVKNDKGVSERNCWGYDKEGVVTTTFQKRISKYNSYMS